MMKAYLLIVLKILRGVTVQLEYFDHLGLEYRMEGKIGGGKFWQIDSFQAFGK